MEPDVFDQIVDDDTPRREAFAWALESITAGRGIEEVLAALLEKGWNRDDAEEIVELARQQTRELRGVKTRDQVVRQANRHYRQGFSGKWFIGLPSLAAMFRLMYSLMAMGTFRRFKKGDGEGLKRD